MVSPIYPSEFQLSKVNSIETEALSLDLHLTISDGFVSFTCMTNATILISLSFHSEMVIFIVRHLTGFLYLYLISFGLLEHLVM